MDSDNPIKKAFYILGTVIVFTIYKHVPSDGILDEAIADEAAERIMEIDDRMSVYKPGSDVSGINANAGITYQSVTDDTWHVVRQAAEYAVLSGGAMDPTIRPLTALWAISSPTMDISASNLTGPADISVAHNKPKCSSLPEDILIRKVSGLVDYNDILFDEDNRSIMLRRKGQALDLGCIAKGYAADEAVKVLKARGVRHATINLGGNIIAIGNRLDGRKWHVGIQDPWRMRGEYMAITSVSDSSVVTSAGYERHFWDGGRRYHHIIDPSTGYPADKHILSATVIAPFSIDADALSTCVFVMGIRKGMELINGFSKHGSANGPTDKGMDIEAIIITEDGAVHTTPGIRQDNRFSLVGKQYHLYEGENAQ